MTLNTLLTWVNTRASKILALCLFAGILLPDLAALARPYLLPAVTILLATAILRMDWRTLAEPLREPVKLAALVILLMVGVPLAAVPLATWLLPAPLALSIGIFATAPILVSMTAYARMLGLDSRWALVLLVGTSLAVPFTLPPLAAGLLHLDVGIGVGELLARLAALVGGAFAAAWLVRKAAGPVRLQHWDSAIGGVGVLLLVVFAFGAVDGFADAIREEPAKVALYMAAAFAANFGLQALAAALLIPLEKPLGLKRAETLTACLAAGNRNFALVVGAIGATSDSALFLYFTCMQFPIYMTPLLLGPIYRRALAKGKKTHVS
jgi:bile acid:Na+ symporter, BASS family